MTPKILTNYFKHLGQQRRDPRYTFVIIGALLVFVPSYLQVRSKGLFDSVERPIFHYFNSLPHGLHQLMYAFTQLGGLGGLIVWCSIAWYLINRRAAFQVAGTGVAAWVLAKVAKGIAHRGRPQDVLHNIHRFGGESFHGFGFPSGHATLSAACATVLYYQIAPRYRKYLLLAVLLVGISRMYLGAHFPLDVVGGWALGALVGATTCIIWGVSTKGLSASKLKKFLIAQGMAISSLTFADVDARGSRPVFIVGDDGKQYFGKVFGKQEHAADWLFKLFRFFRYKNLQAEEPYLSSKRNVEIESFAMLWAQNNGIRVAQVCDIYRYGTSWISIQDRIDAKPLSEHGHLLAGSLVDTWKQVSKLHAGNMAHRDLRAANIMIDKAGAAWIIDFGFAEVSANRQRKAMDVAELLMSMTLVVGVDRTIEAARKGMSKAELKAALPFLQTAVFSGATTKLLKQNKPLLKELKDELNKALHIKHEVEEETIVRFSGRKIFNLVLLALFVYLIAPQFASFKQAFDDVMITNYWYLLILAMASLATYVLTGIIYVVLSDVPLKIWQSTLVQLAASFTSKVLPGGLGGTSLNIKYLTRSGLDGIQASTIIASQALLGFIMFIVPLLLYLTIAGHSVFGLFHFKIGTTIVIGVIIVVAIIGGVLAFVPKIRLLVLSKLATARESLRNISTSPRELSLACAASLSVSLAYIACLYFAAHAIGLHISVANAIIVYVTSVIAKSAVPTPGGLGPVEAAMIGTLVAFGVSKGEAFSAVIIYRLATFWIPVPFSLMAYKYIDSRKII